MIFWLNYKQWLECAVYTRSTPLSLLTNDASLVYPHLPASQGLKRVCLTFILKGVFSQVQDMVLGDLLASLLKYKVKKRSVKYAINTSALRQIAPK